MRFQTGKSGDKPLKIASFQAADGQVRVGVVESDMVRDVTLAAGGSLSWLIEHGDLERVRAATGESYELAAVRLLEPVSRHARIFGIGLNYAEHAEESKMKTQAVPTVFLKLGSSLCGPGEDVILPPESEQVDYEAELAVVIGKPGRRIAEADWERHVFGYTIVNDVSARDVQLATSQWTLGKSFPTFTPAGPWIVTPDELGDPHALGIRLAIDGEELQSSNTRHLIFRVPALIAYLSGIVELEAGDVISTGTPAGVGLGRSPQRWLKPGEEMVIEVDGIGVLRNRTRAEG
jgi:2-keto-4-pentenoate hydratase/2-oxohepta-3-ene-1,7-dioic acid hydratase in catechol pathway